MHIVRSSPFRPSAAWLAVALACSGTASRAAQADLGATADAKRALMAFMAGTYATECAKGRGHDMPMPRSGTPIVFAADGTISWGGQAFNITRSYVNEMGVTRSGGAFASKIDIENEGNGQRIAVAGITQPKGQSAGASVTVGDDASTAPFGLCQGTVPGAATPLWPTAARLLATPSRTAACMDMKAMAQLRAEVAFDGRQLVIGSHKYTPAAAADEETLSVDDGKGEIGYSFGTTGEMVIVTRPAGGKSRHFQVTPVSNPMAGFSCDVD